MIDFFKYPRGPDADDNIKIFRKLLVNARLQGYKTIFIDYEISLNSLNDLENQIIALFGDIFLPAIDPSFKTRLTLKCFEISEYNFFFSKCNRHVLRIFDSISVRPCSQIVFDYVVQKCVSTERNKIPFKILTFSIENEENSRETVVTDIKITYEQARSLKHNDIIPELLYADLRPLKEENIIFAHDILTKFYWKNVMLSSGQQQEEEIISSPNILTQAEKDSLIKRLAGKTLEG